MSYNDNIEKESIESQYIIVLKPNRIAEDFTLISSTKYKKTLDYGEIVKLTSNGSDETKATSSTLSDGAWFFDISSNILYIDIGSDVSLKTIIITYEIYIATLDAYFNRDPLDDTTRTVYYEPLITITPNVNQSTQNLYFGFITTSATQIGVSNATNFFQKHLYDSNFHNIDVNVYNYVGKLKTENVKLIFNGICSSIKQSESTISFRILDKTQTFTNTFRIQQDEQFYKTSLLPALDPNFNNTPIRSIFNFVDNILPVNIQYNETASTTDNKIWVTNGFRAGSFALSTVLASPASTATRTYINSTGGIQLDDSVFINSSSGASFDESVIITNINRSTYPYYIEHDTITNPAASGSTVERCSGIGWVKLIQNNDIYKLKYQKHYFSYNGSFSGGSVYGFSLSPTLETDLGIGQLSYSDTIYCRAYGDNVIPTINGSNFGTLDPETNSVGNGVVVLYKILTQYLNIPESEIDTAAFQSALSSITTRVGFITPKFARDSAETYKSIINNILRATFLRLYLNDVGKWTVSQIKPITATADYIITNDDILKGSYNYNIDYNDIYKTTTTKYKIGEVTSTKIIGEHYVSKTKTNNNVKYLFNIDKIKVIDTALVSDDEATIFNNRMGFIFNERAGTLQLSVKAKFLKVKIGDTIKINISNLIGYDYDVSTLRDRTFTVIGINRDIRKITLTLDDQKGIQDNQGAW